MCSSHCGDALTHPTRLAPTSFCKCVCFKNSTIIALDGPEQQADSDSRRLLLRDEKNELEEGSDEKKAPYRPKNCNDCSKKFCLNHNLPICKGAKEEDVFTTCFRKSCRRINSGFGAILGARHANAPATERDSSKDQAIVFIFIFMTTGLLGWALIRPWVGDWVEVITERPPSSLHLL